MTSLSETAIVGTSEKITFPLFNKSITAKVDTGASTCCLHATNIRVDDRSQKVSFSCPDLSNNIVTLPLVSVVEVHSADHGGDSRPVVELDVVFQNQQFSKVQFNLNDRSGMDTKVLVGGNLLKQGDFAVKVTETPDPETADVGIVLHPVVADRGTAIGITDVVYDPETNQLTIQLDLSSIIPK